MPEIPRNGLYFLLLKCILLSYLQVIDILLGYIDVGVMMQKPSSAREVELRDHYKVGVPGSGELEGGRERGEVGDTVVVSMLTHPFLVLAEG